MYKLKWPLKKWGRDRWRFKNANQVFVGICSDVTSSEELVSYFLLEEKYILRRSSGEDKTGKTRRKKQVTESGSVQRSCLVV